jgi:hypothetical protein
MVWWEVDKNTDTDRPPQKMSLVPRFIEHQRSSKSHTNMRNLRWMREGTLEYHHNSREKND